jgi:AraC-like DNA-binding protein
LRISSELYFRAELAGDFAIELPSERRHIRFHLVRRGRCWIALPGGEARALSEGDLAIVPDGVAQILSSSPDVAPVPLMQVLTEGALHDGVLKHGTGDRHTGLLCGFCRFDEGIDHPVLANLPALMVLRPGELGGEPWATAALRLLSMEADLNGQGAGGILGRLLEIIFMQAVRRMTSGQNGTVTGYMAALSDVQLSRALQAIHKEPHHTWTIQALAERAGMSRARFADRFTAVVGMPPIGYLTAWRLIKARAMLSSTDLGMEDIAGRCGYASVPSFSRRFKQTFNVGPGTYRRLSRSV